MKTSTFCTLTFVAMSAACAADKPSESVASSDDVSVQVAFYGLTVVDCQQQATQCFQDDTRRFLRRPLGCSAKLARCLATASREAAKDVIAETGDVAACAESGAKCFEDAGKLSAVFACENDVERCVLTSVNDLTGIPLPTSQEIAFEVVKPVGQIVGHTAATVETVLEVTVDTAGEVIETTAQAAGEVVETAADVTSEVVATTAEVTGEVVETGVAVTGEVLETATGVVGDLVDVGVTTAKSALQCGEESRTCIRTTKKLLSCQLAYAECLSAAL